MSDMSRESSSTAISELDSLLSGSKLSEAENIIQSFLNVAKMNGLSRDDMRKVFGSAYSYHFAYYLKYLLNRGDFAYELTSGRTYWEDENGKLYSIEGEYEVNPDSMVIHHVYDDTTYRFGQNHRHNYNVPYTFEDSVIRMMYRNYCFVNNIPHSLETERRVCNMPIYQMDVIVRDLTDFIEVSVDEFNDEFIKYLKVEGVNIGKMSAFLNEGMIYPVMLLAALDTGCVVYDVYSKQFCAIIQDMEFYFCDSVKAHSEDLWYLLDKRIRTNLDRCLEVAEEDGCIPENKKLELSKSLVEIYDRMGVKL